MTRAYVCMKISEYHPPPPPHTHTNPWALTPMSLRLMPPNEIYIKIFNAYLLIISANGALLRAKLSNAS